jgi:hydrogenase maturation factor
MPPLPVGKLPADMLARLLARLRPRDARVVMGPRVGEDAAVLDMGDRYLVAATDPITFATDALGRYAVQVNANDVAVRGARPRWFLAVLLLPERGTTEGLAERVFADLEAACEEMDVTLVGGHTEITAGLDRPIVVGTMLGEVAPERLVTTGGARVGDTLLLSKGVPLEGAAIMARERGAEAERRGVPRPVVERARDFVRHPGLSVVPECLAAVGVARVHAMHDPTEGGLATACWEVAQAAGVGLRVEREQVPVLSEAARLCEAFGLDPLGTIASGALLLAVAPEDANPVAEACRARGAACGPIGRVTPPEDGVVLVRGGRPGPMPVFARDEISKVFSGS